MNWSAIAAVLLALAVILGAFGAHGLRDRLDAYSMSVYEKAVFYHFIHAVMLFVLADSKPFRTLAWWSFIIGICVFSGSLYLLAVTNAHWLGAITPIGGVSFLFGWAWLIFKPAREDARPTN